MSDPLSSSSTEEFDIGPLTWVKKEIHFALAHADENLSQFLTKTDDINLMQTALRHLHQVTGALRMVGLEPVMLVSSTAEKLVNAFISNEVSPARENIAIVKSAIKALGQYLDGLMRGARNQPLALFPTYKALLLPIGVTTCSPVDLFFPKLLSSFVSQNTAPTAMPENFNTWLSVRRGEYQKGLLLILRGGPHQPVLSAMEKIIAAIEKTQSGEARILWWIASAFLSGLASTATAPTAFQKQLCGRLDVEIKRQLDGIHELPDRLIRELLFAIAYMQPATQKLKEIQDAYQLRKLIPSNTKDDPQNTRVKIVIGDLRSKLDAVKEAWNACVSNDLSNISQFNLEAAQLNNFAQSFDNKSLKTLFAKLVDVANDLAINPREINDALALEVATLLLMASEALDNYNHLGKDFRAMTQTAVVRISAALNNKPLPPGGTIVEYVNPHRDPNEHKLFMQLGQESLKTLNQVEDILDGFFRDNTRINELSQISNHTKQLEGVLRILESKKALPLLNACQKIIDKFLNNGGADKGDMELIADGFSNLGLFIMGVQQGYKDPDELLDSSLKLFGLLPDHSK